MITVETFYNEHPINETEVLEKVEATGKSLEELTAEDLYPFDQDHYGGCGCLEGDGSPGRAAVRAGTRSTPHSWPWRPAPA